MASVKLIGLGDKVKVLVGKNKGQIGKVTYVDITANVAYVNFNKKILVNNGTDSFTNQNEGYIVGFESLEIAE